MTTSLSIPGLQRYEIEMDFKDADAPVNNVFLKVILMGLSSNHCVG